ncbi:tryptophan halogenase family protein [Sphingomonas sp. FW199]|uniref:tryptophan halogenase family protein n=1 Tax=Sphingomonas sp. FW199 TaxID=3400217 RepID=UPI003CF81DF9
MTREPISRVVIAGGGTAGWMAAAVLSKTFADSRMEIALVESPEIGPVGVGEATIPPILTLNRLLGLDEDELVRRTAATFKLGIEFKDWGNRGESYFHPFGTYGADTQGVDFHHHWLRLGRGDLAEYSLPTMAARQHRFTRPVDDPRHVHSRMAYALHFDAGLYAAYLRDLSVARGVSHLTGTIADVRMDDRGHVSALTLTDGRELPGDLFIDCTGFRGLLIEGALNTGYESWADWLPMDRAVAMPTTSSGTPPPYTRATARKAGWHWRIPLQHRTGNGHVYCSSHVSDDEAAADLVASVEGQPLADPRFLRFKTGRRRKAWNANVVSLGLASGFIEPLESTSIHLIQQGVVTLMSLFPDKRFDPATVDQYNRFMQREFESVRDFIILHYHLNRRADSTFWTEMREMTVPDSLQHRLSLFADAGRVFTDAGELFTPTSWVAVMMGQGMMPGGHDPVADTLPAATMQAKLDQMRAVIERGVAAMPTHQAFIDAHCRTQVSAPGKVAA